MIINNLGSMVAFVPEGEFEYEWLMMNVDAEPYQWIGRKLMVDQRYSLNLFVAVQSTGFVMNGDAASAFLETLVRDRGW